MVATTIQTTTPAEPVTTAAPVPALRVEGAIGVFDSLENFEAAQRMAKAMSASTMVPKEYQGNLSNCIIALEYASRTRSSPLAVMQSLNIIHGRPSLSAAFAIASVNTSGRFTEISYQWQNRQGPVEQWACRAVAVSRATGEVLEGTWITWEMAKAEGWTTKAGSKWRTMPEQMFRYRAGTFWCRAYAPEILLGMRTTDEVDDIVTQAEAPSSSLLTGTPVFADPASGMAGLDAALADGMERGD